MRLDAKATEYLRQLASPTSGRRDHASVEAAADGSGELIEQFAMPAIVANRCLEVLAANSIARALSPGFAPGQNFLRWRLLDPAARDLYAVTGTGARDVYATGTLGAVVHWDGTRWQTETTDVGMDLRAAVVTGGRDVQALGDGGGILRKRRP